MSLELFINSERCSNGNYFYREISDKPFTATLRLSSTSKPNNVVFSNNYLATYYLNGDKTNIYSFNVDNPTNLLFQRTSPTLSSVCLSLSSIDGTFLQDFVLSVKFVTKFPKVNLIAYPSRYIQEYQLKPITHLNLNDSPGVYFYGEGHTETINLSCNVQNSNSQTIHEWYIGNNISDFKAPSVTSKVALENNKSNTTTVSITSTTGTDQKISISLFATNDEIDKNGPIIFYDDITGVPSFYPFFETTMTVQGEHVSTNKFKESIHVKPYPLPTTYTLNDPFSADQIVLSNGLGQQTFRASLTHFESEQILTTKLSSTVWELKQYSDLADWEYQTQPLKNITDYVFPLSYENQTDTSSLINLFSVPSVEKSSVVLSVSALQSTCIEISPYDWQPKNQIEVHTSRLVQILPLPFVELFVHNYYVVKYAPFPIKSINVYANKNTTLKKIILSTNESSKTYELSAFNTNPFAVISFEKLGKKTIFVKSVFEDTITKNTFEVIDSFVDIVEVVSKYDDTTEFASSFDYRTKTTDLPFVYSSSDTPLIAPNEWIVESNVNYPLKQLYSLIENISQCADYFQPSTKFLGWYGNSKITWSNLECFPETTNRSEWAKYVIKQTLDQSEVIPVIWDEHNCVNKIIDPSCFQKYCIEWKWSSRTREVSDLVVTWKTARGIDIYQKKWKFEPCELDSTSIICETGRWNKPKFDSNNEPILTLGINDKPECFVKGFVKTKDNVYILARETEILALTDSEVPEIISKLGIADEIFAFSKIEKLSINQNGNIYILDSQIPRVCVLELKSGKFRHLNSWGNFGSKSSLYGFYKPGDMHIDQNQCVWIVDTGNNCIKQYTSTGKYIQTLFVDLFNKYPPLSLVVDSQHKIHVLTSISILTFVDGVLSQETTLPSYITEPKKINCSFNREMMYITHKDGVTKYFRNNNLFGNLVSSLKATNGSILKHFVDVYQDEYRNTYVVVEDKILKFADRMKSVTNKAKLNKFWSIEDILIKDKDYIQPIVYLNAFHKLWDNIELLRNSLFYYKDGTTYTPPTYKKEDIVIGQNELVTHSVVNRCISQLWTNIQTVLQYVLPKT